MARRCQIRHSESGNGLLEQTYQPKFSSCGRGEAATETAGPCGVKSAAGVQALEKELANFGKEKDKHIKVAQAKAKKAKADTEVPFVLLS